MSRHDRGVSRPLGQARSTWLLGLCVGAVALAFLAAAWQEGDFAVDLRNAYLPAARAVADGVSPYPPDGSTVVDERAAYAYPPFLAVVLVPVSWLPEDAIAVAAVVVLAGMLIATLRLLDVRDPRCYLVVFAWGPVLHALQTANLSIPLALAAAAAWRWRTDTIRGGVALGAALAPKLFLWPLALWALATRRAGMAAVGLTSALAAIVAAWALIGFAGLGSYPDLVRRIAETQEDDAYTVYALALDAGLPGGAARALWLACGVAALVAVVVLGRRDDDRRSFALAVVAALLLTPTAWLHSFVVLLVPLALARPRLDWAWVAPVALIVAAGTGNGAPWQTLLVLVVAAAVAAASVGPRSGVPAAVPA